MTTPTPQATPHRLTDDAGAVVAFDGVPLARVSSMNDTSKRWNYTDLAVYRTSEGRFVVERVSVRDARIAEHSVKAFASRQLAQQWLGFGALSLRLYAAAGWPL